MMRKFHLLWATALLVGAASPALSAENLDCVDVSMTDAQRDSFLATMQNRAPVDQAVFVIIRACAAQHGWSDAAQRHAVMHTLGRIVRQSLRRAAPLSDEQLRAAERAYDSVFTEAESRAMLASNMSPAQSQRLTRALNAADIVYDAEIFEWLGSLLMATQMEKISRIDFAGA